MAYDRRGNPLSHKDWSRLFTYGGWDYKVVAKTQIGPYLVSTVWLGLDHGFGMTEQPLIFETMVFNERTGDTDVDQMHRYATEDEAIRGHEEIEARIRTLYRATKGIDPPGDDDHD